LMGLRSRVSRSQRPAPYRHTSFFRRAMTEGVALLGGRSAPQEIKEPCPTTPLKTTRTTLKAPRDAASKHARSATFSLMLSTLRSQLPGRTKIKPETQGNSRQEQIDSLYVAIWDRILRVMSRVVVNHETKDWPEYFNGLRHLVHRVLAESTASDLSANEKTDLAHRLVGRINQLEKWWPSGEQTKIEQSKVERL
jgi:hypothetical protein